MSRWWRDTYRDAVWESETLTAAEKAVAETYARHAHNRNGERTPTADLAWLTYDRLMAKAGIRRRANVAAAIGGLVEAGWLVSVREAGRRSTIFRLTIPEVGSSDGGTTGSSDGGTTETGSGSSDVGTTVVPLSKSGSSTQSDLNTSRSSDGGTQPLVPLEEQQQRPSAHSRARAQQQQNQKPPAYVARIVKAVGATESEAAAVAQLIRERRSPTNLGGLINTIAGAGELGIWLDEVRATAQEGHHAVNAAMPVCEHGYPDGHVTEALTGWAPCPVHRWAGVTPDRVNELHADLERMRAEESLPADVESVIYAAFSDELLDALSPLEDAAKKAA